MTASYAPGLGVALVGHSAWALLQVPMGDPLIEALWPAIEQGSPIGDVLDVLVQKGLSDLPSLAVVHVSDKLRLVVRSSAVVDVDSGDTAQRFEATQLVSWLEQTIAPVPSRIVVSLPGAPLDLPTFPSGGGVVLADRLEIAPYEFALERPVAPLPSTTPRPGEPAASPTVDVPLVPDDMAPDEVEEVAGQELTVAEAASSDVTEAVVEPTAADGAVSAPVPSEDNGGLPEHSDQTLTFRDELVSAASEEPPVEDGPSYDHLFGATINRVPEIPVMGEPSVPAAPAIASVPVSAPAPVLAVAPPAAISAAIPPASVTAAPSGGLIDAVPGAGPSSAPSSGPAMAPSTQSAAAVAPPVAAPVSSFAPGGSDVSDVDERTMKRPQELAELLRSTAAAGDRVGPVVHAVSCLKGHLNDPQATTCRTCKTALPMQDPVTVPRPVLGVLRLSTGDVVQLDRGVLLGRSPSTKVEGVDRPHLVKVTSPDNDISRNHVEVQLDGWHVLVRDLKTTNGTLVQLPGEEPVRLRPEDPMAIKPGSTVMLAEHVSFTFEVEG